MGDDSWTDEKHLHFLSSLEASFLRSMFENKDRPYLHLHLRLDRYLPDTCESTLDLKPPTSSSSSSSSHRRKSSTTTATSGFARMDGRICKRSRRVSSRPHDSSADQVVPQMKNGSGGEDERDYPDVPGTRQAAGSS